MKQIIQSLSNGNTSLENIPSSQPRHGELLIRTHCSLVSAGTERMLLDFGRANWLDKARQQPDKVQDVLQKVRTDGLFSTYEAIRSKLDQPLPLGYCNVGSVVAVGTGVQHFKVGDRVVSNGPHSELVSVPQLLCAPIPDHVSDESAAFTILASIGLQGIRLASPSLGETFVVTGLGLIGLLTAQLLQAQGCRVLGIDPDPDKCSLAAKLGIDVFTLGSNSEALSWISEHTNSIGVDGVLITAATSSSDPVHLAAQACRKRGRIILVGVTGLDLRRDLFYKKELVFQVSCSYGPGRYDPSYEQHGHDYPVGYVRWTEQRNFQAVLHALNTGSVKTDSLISHRFSIDQATDAYELLCSSRPSLGIIIQYEAIANYRQCTVPLVAYSDSTSFRQTNLPNPTIGVIGTGNYASRTLIPAFAKAGANFSIIGSSKGIGPVHLGRRFGFREATTDISSVISDPNCNLVVIATRHDSHASLVLQALDAGKHVFVEKPLCLTINDLNLIEAAYSEDQLLMVGFNRRFAPLLIELATHLRSLSGPKAFVYTCNAGSIPPEHWTQDPLVGGGRLLGEACHFVDLLRHLAASPIEDLQIHSAKDSKSCPDTFSIQLRFADGSIGTVHYFASGSKAFPKERLEVFASGTVFRLDNFRKLQAWGMPGFRTRRLFVQDKGHVSCCSAVIKALETGSMPPIPAAELFEVQRRLLEA